MWRMATAACSLFQGAHLGIVWMRRSSTSPTLATGSGGGPLQISPLSSRRPPWSLSTTSASPTTQLPIRRRHGCETGPWAAPSGRFSTSRFRRPSLCKRPPWSPRRLSRSNRWSRRWACATRSSAWCAVAHTMRTSKTSSSHGSACVRPCRTKAKAHLSMRLRFTRATSPRMCNVSWRAKLMVSDSSTPVCSALLGAFTKSRMPGGRGSGSGSLASTRRATATCVASCRCSGSEPSPSTSTPCASTTTSACTGCWIPSMPCASRARSTAMG
mmetsp:Transcript_19885/g.53412  ORF Transcript_19885/g.53412 Transcript_19885/m.53412 type:complete len:271 (-) Transcript_19885:1077-1889(-)